jgi:hypothetical protein
MLCAVLDIAVLIVPMPVSWRNQQGAQKGAMKVLQEPQLLFPRPLNKKKNGIVLTAKAS